MKRVVRATVLATLLVLLAAVAMPASAAPGPPAPFAAQIKTLYSTSPQSNLHFGSSVAVDWNILVVGEPDYNSSQGAVYVSECVAGVWSAPVRITAPGGALGDKFGASVGVSNGTIVVGAPQHDTTAVDAGAVYAFRKTGATWGLVGADHFVQASPAALDHFGQAVAIDNNYVAIGCPNDDETGTDSGSVYVFQWTGVMWTRTGPLVSPIGQSGDRLGGAVDVDEPTRRVVAGATGADSDSYLDCGSASIFEYSSGWGHSDTIWAPPARQQTNAYFGTSVAICPERIVVGAPNLDFSPSATDSGEAYTFTKPVSFWAPEDTLYNPNPSTGDQYGWSVAAEGSTFFVSAWWDDGYVGAIYPYTRWYGATVAWPKISASVTSGSVAHFGTSIAVFDGMIISGAQMSSSGSVPQCGGAYLFTSKGTVDGVVRDADTGALLPNMEVYGLPVGAPADDEYVATTWASTNLSGAFSLPLTTGRYVLQAMDPSATFYATFYNGAPTYTTGNQIAVAPNASVSGVTIYMYRIGAVYRFYRPSTGTHFYTPLVSERDNVIATLSGTYQYEGIAYVTDPITDNVPLERFYNIKNGSHFYTADPSEAANVKVNLKGTYVYDGPTYGVSLAPGPGKRPVYRFYNMRNGSHFYTASETERATVEATLGGTYKLEGPAFWIDN